MPLQSLLLVFSAASILQRFMPVINFKHVNSPSEFDGMVTVNGVSIL